MADRHPHVVFNAITSPQRSEGICYPDEAAAFDAMCTYRPFNNTRLSPQWCDKVHCPHGCRTGGGRDRPVLQEPLMFDLADATYRATNAGRWRCPKCHCEYAPGYPPGMSARQLAQLLTDTGLTDVRFHPYGDWPVCVTGIIPEGGDSGLHVVRVVEHRAPRNSIPKRLREPYWLGLYEPNALDWVTRPLEHRDELTIHQLRDEIVRYL